jgi:hypothetical protein
VRFKLTDRLSGTEESVLAKKSMKSSGVDGPIGGNSETNERTLASPSSEGGIDAAGLIGAVCTEFPDYPRQKPEQLVLPSLRFNKP